MASSNTKLLILPLIIALALLSGRHLPNTVLSEVKVQKCAASDTDFMRAIDAGQSRTPVNELDSEPQNSYTKQDSIHWPILTREREEFGPLIIYKHHRINHRIDDIIICDIDQRRLH